MFRRSQSYSCLYDSTKFSSNYRSQLILALRVAKLAPWGLRISLRPRSTKNCQVYSTLTCFLMESKVIFLRSLTRVIWNKSDNVFTLLCGEV